MSCFHHLAVDISASLIFTKDIPNIFPSFASSVDSGKCYFHSCDHERENIPQTNKSILLLLNKLLKLAYLALSAQNKEKKKQQKCVDKFDLFVKVFMSNQLLEIRQGLSFEEFFPSTMFGKTSKMSQLNFCAKKGDSNAKAKFF